MDITTATNQLRLALRKDDKVMLDSSLESLKSHYSTMAIETLYPHLMYCHVVLFGGSMEKINKDLGKLCKSNDIKDKYDHLAADMRDSLTSTIPESDIISRLYDMIVSYPSNDNNIWTALFAVAAEEKTDPAPKPPNILNFPGPRLH